MTLCSAKIPKNNLAARLYDRIVNLLDYLHRIDDDCVPNWSFYVWIYPEIQIRIQKCSLLLRRFSFSFPFRSLLGVSSPTLFDILCCFALLVQANFWVQVCVCGSEQEIMRRLLLLFFLFLLVLRSAQSTVCLFVLVVFAAAGSSLFWLRCNCWLHSSDVVAVVVVVLSVVVVIVIAKRVMISVFFVIDVF